MDKGGKRLSEEPLEFNISRLGFELLSDESCFRKANMGLCFIRTTDQQENQECFEALD